MLTDEDFKTPLVVEDVANALMFVLFEVAVAFSPTQEVANEKLEDIASRLLSVSGRIPESATKTLVLALMQNLVQTEPGAQH